MRDDVFSLPTALITCAIALIINGCAASLPAPELAEHRDETYIDVPYPPPAALAETVPPRPERQDARWVDGDWAFRGKSYSWQRGGWFQTMHGAHYAPSQVKYTADGRVLFAPGTWYGATGEVLQRPNRILPATTPPNEFTSESMVGR